jgi:hypothetical protein
MARREGRDKGRGAQDGRGAQVSATRVPNRHRNLST